MTTILLRDENNFCTICSTDGRHFITVVSGGAFPHTMTFLLKADEAERLVGNPARRKQLVYDIIRPPESFSSRRIQPPLDT